MSRFVQILAVIAVAAVFVSPPLAAELCDGRDDDADGTVDEGCPRTCADPRAEATESLLTTASAEASFGRDRVAVWDGAGLGIVWSQESGPQTEIVFQRVGPSGRLMGAPLSLGLGDAELDPVIAWSGDGYGIVWSSIDTFLQDQLRYAFVDRDGNLVHGPVNINTETIDVARPAIAWDGTHFVVTWTRDFRVQFRKVAIDGTPATAQICLTCSPLFRAFEVSIAVGPGQYGIAFGSPQPFFEMFFLRADTDGNVLGTVVEMVDAVGADFPSIAFGPGEYAMVWADRRNSIESIQLARIGTDGVRIGGDQQIDAAREHAWQPNIVWTGEEYFVGWAGELGVGEYGNFLQRVDATGARVGPDLFVEEGAFHRMHPNIVWTGSRIVQVRDEEEIAFPRPLYLRNYDCCSDSDGDGVDWCDGDAHDDDALVFAGAAELCDARDNDLDGTIDEGCDRMCDGAPFFSAGTLAQQSSDRVGLDARESAPSAFVSHADDADASVELVLDRGGPPWTAAALETDPAASDQPTTHWTGTRAATVFVDDRGAPPQLRFASQDASGAILVADEPLSTPSASTAEPRLDWAGRRFAVVWQDDDGTSNARTSWLTTDGARLIEDLIVSEVPSGQSSVDVASDAQRGAAIVYLKTDGANASVVLELRDARGGLRTDPIEIAAPAAGRRDPALVRTSAGFVIVWSQDTGARELIVAHTDEDGVLVSGPTALTSGGGPADAPALAYTGEELLVVFRDARDGTSKPYVARLDSAGARLEADRLVGEAGIDESIGPPRAAYNGRDLWMAWTRDAGGVQDVRVGRLDCLAPPGVALVTGLTFDTKDQISWDVLAGATFDVVSGDLGVLASGAGFTAAIDACEASQTASTSLTLPVRPLPRFYLVRAIVGGDTGSYDSGGTAQQGSRDAAIDASPAACP